MEKLLRNLRNWRSVKMQKGLIKIESIRLKTKILSYGIKILIFMLKMSNEGCQIKVF